MRKLAAAVIAVIGSRGSGKSLWVKQYLERRKAKRLLIWDPMREYGHMGSVAGSLAAVADLIEKAGKGAPFCIVYQPVMTTQKLIDRQFALICRLSMLATACVLLVEELSLVTKAQSAPPAWSELITTGRHHDVEVIGTTQRPALVDKTFFGNATIVRVGRLNYRGDKKTMADALDMPIGDLADLLPLNFIQKDMETGKITRDIVVIPGQMQKKSPAAVQSNTR